MVGGFDWLRRPQLLAGQDPASVMRQDGLLGELKKALLNRLGSLSFVTGQDPGVADLHPAPPGR